MPASGTMAAPFGRVMSGRGFAPTGYEAYDLPAAGQFTRDLPSSNGNTTAEAWLHQAKILKSLQGMSQHGSSNQIPSGLPGARSFRGADDPELYPAAKRPRLMLPDYGRSASDPPLSFQRRNAHAMNVPVETLKLAAAKPAAAQMPKTLRSFQSGPARVAEGKPSPNYRIYSNAFQGGRVEGEGGPPFNYSRSKAEVSPPAPTKAPTPSQQPARNDPTPHPAFLKQPLVSSRTDQGTSHPKQASSQRPRDQDSSQRPEQAPAESPRDKSREAGKQESDAKQQQGHSAPQGAHLESSSNPSRDPSPQPASSPKHSASHSAQSDEDTEMEEASHGTHVVAPTQGPSPRAAATCPEEAAEEVDQGLGQTGGGRMTPGASTAKNPAPDPRDSSSPTCRDGKAFGREGESKRKSLDSRDVKRKPSSVKTDVSSKGRPSKTPARPWGTLSGALQPAGPAVQDSFLPGQRAAEAANKSAVSREATMTEGNLQRLLLQLTDAQGRAYQQNGGMAGGDSQEHFLAGNPNMPRAPLQAQLHVMRNSFNRLSRPEAEQAGGYPHPHPSRPSSFPPPGLSPHGQEHHRGSTAPNHVEFGAIPHGGKQPLMPISSSTLSSLPPSVAAFYESEQRKQQHHQQQQAMGPASALNRHINGIKYSHRQLARQHAQQRGGNLDSNLAHYLQAHRGPGAGYAHSANPRDGPHMGGRGYNDGGLGSDLGYRVPSHVVTMDGGVRNPALLNRPVLASHQDPQLSSRDQHLGYPRDSSWLQGSAQNFEGYHQELAQHAQRDPGRGTRGPPSSSLSQQDSRHLSPHAWDDVLSKSNLSSAELAQLCSYATTGFAGNLNQLITQLQMMHDLAHPQSEPTQPQVETTHRVVIPATHLKDRSHAVSRQAAAPLANMRVQSGRAMVADFGGNRGQQGQQGRAVEAAAPREPPSALDVVAEAAAAEAAAEAANDEEPSELLMLAAETLAGLNTIQPRPSADHPKPAHSSLESTPGNDSPAAARKLSKQLADSNRKQKRRLAQLPKATNVTTAVAAHAGSGGASVHPILGFSVPHSRRSYHRDTHVAPAKQRFSSATLVHPEVRKDLGEFRSSAAAAPAAGRQRKPNTAAPHARSAFARSDLPRVASDSSLTVSADST